MKCIEPCARAATHGRSTEAEVQAILESVVKPEGRLKLGSLLVDIGRQARLREEEAAIFSSVRDKTPAPVVDFNDPA